MTTEREALENDIRELRGAEPDELARRLIERGWSTPQPTDEAHPVERQGDYIVCTSCGARSHEPTDEVRPHHEIGTNPDCDWCRRYTEIVEAHR